MLSVAMNERLIQVGPGTPMGELMRRYWHPIAAVPELNRKSPTKPVRLHGENLTLYQDRSGDYGLIDDRCPHRRMNMEYGIVEEHGLRCPYHGWLFDETGQCQEMPAEAADTTFKDRIKVKAYPVEVLGGLIFAYMGPEPRPLLSRWEWLVDDHAYRQVNFLEIPCNWLQCQENSLDPIHLEWMHLYNFNFGRWKDGEEQEDLPAVHHHKRIGFDVFEHGIIKRCVYEGFSEEGPDWAIDHPILFPNLLSDPNQFRVPIDDTHTLHVDYVVRHLPDDVVAPDPNELKVYYPPLTDENGKYVLNYVFGQDYMGWATQGPIAERNLEKLGESDKGIIMFRRMLQEQLSIVEDGGDPMNVFRDPATNLRVELPNETKGGDAGGDSGRKTQLPSLSEERPAWLNSAPWAGQGFRYYLEEVGALTAPTGDAAS
jgi:5,5'-dehydrodivanillate O-demethylase